MFLSHVKTKNELTNYLAEKAIINLKNVNGGYAVGYATECISNLEDFTKETMTNDHEEADTLLLLHVADVSARNRFTEFHICSPDTNVLPLTIHKYPILCANTAVTTSSAKQVRTIPIR